MNLKKFIMCEKRFDNTASLADHIDKVQNNSGVDLNVSLNSNNDFDTRLVELAVPKCGEDESDVSTNTEKYDFVIDFFQY